MINQDIKIQEVKKIFSPFKEGVKRKAQGALKYDYIVPSGVYQEQWDWDGFFIGIALASQIPSEAIYLRNWALNFICNSRKDGYTPGCITPKGRDERLNQMKPFLAQGAYFASNFLNDFSWIKPHIEKLINIVLYREKNLWNKTYDLGVWFNSMESGADNNVAALDFPNKTVIATDLNSYVYREYKALSLILKKLNNSSLSKTYEKRANEIKKNINKYLWDEKDGVYYNVDGRDGKFIKRVSFNCILPLWAAIALPQRAKRFIKEHMLSPKKLWTEYGIRTLSRDDKGYNNVNMIKPHSNWQGPVWPIANYLSIHALLNYGYTKDALKTAENITQVCINDIRKTGGMHEDYNAETGEPLAAPNFISWNLLVPNLIEEVLQKRNPILI